MEKLNSDVFLKVVETGSFKRAADALGYTQAGISYIINAMEEEFGLKLFHREYGGVRLTPDGEYLHPLIQRIHDDEHYLQEAINEVRNLQTGTVRVLTFNSVYINWLPGIIRKFKERYPNIEFEISSCEEDSKAEEMIRNGDVDCGFLSNPPTLGIDYFPLMEDSFLATLPLDHPMADKKKFPLSEIGNYPYIMFSFDKRDFNPLVFRDDITPQTVLTVDNDFAAMAMVSQGLGMAIFPQILLNDAPFPLRCLEFDPPVERTIVVATRSMDTCTRAAREFIRCVREWIEEQDFSLEQGS